MKIMRFFLYAMCAAVVLLLALGAGAQAQSGRSKQSGGEGKKNRSEAEQQRQQARPDEVTSDVPEKDGEQETVKIETNLVTVPVIVSTRGGIYVPDMRQEEFSVFEDGVQQQVSFFATVTEPFHVVLMIDTSASTEEKLYQIQKAANAFVAQLQTGDRVKLLSFDDRVRDFGNFTNDRALLAGQIGQLRPGRGTKLYDAMDAALIALERVKGRKAIVIFTDGVDWHSAYRDADDNFRAIEEAGIIIYPIRYDTRAETERIARQQARGGQTVDLASIFGGGLPRTTPSTFPGGTGQPLPTGGGTGRLPGPIVVTRDPGGTGGSTGPDASSRYPDPRNGPTQLPTTPGQQTDADISRMLDAAYAWADSYLNDLAYKSGGRLMRADTLGSLPDAFGQIAAELRTQYSLGYYPPPSSRDGKQHKIQVRTTRKGVQVRARPLYRSKPLPTEK